MEIKIEKKSDKKKVRVNITVDKELLNKAKGKLELFGGKLSTLFNSYLNDFVTSIDKKFNENHKVMEEKMKELEGRLKKVERKKKQQF